MSPTARVMAAGVLFGSLVLIVVATTMPWSRFVGHPHWGNVEWIPFSYRVRPDDLLLNVLLFVPFGSSAFCTFSPEAADNGLARRRWSRLAVAVVSAGCLVSLAVELFQVYCHGRMPTTVDVLGNTLGTFLGARWADARWGPARGVATGPE